MNNNEKPPCVIAISDGKLAIFGSRCGFLGEVIQEYTSFENKNTAIEEAKLKIKSLGRECDPEISEPRITSMKITYSKRKK